MSSSTRSLLIIFIASLFLLMGLLCNYLPIIVENQMRRTIELATNQEVIKFWSKPPIEIPSYIWLYNITNAEQFMEGGKVKVEKVGPFRLKYRMEKRIIELSQNKFRVTYNTTRFYSYNESTIGNLDVPITVISPIFPSIVENLLFREPSLDQTESKAAFGTVEKLAEKYNETLLMNATPRMFILGTVSKFLRKMKVVVATLGEDASSLGDGMVGLMPMLNGTLSGPFEIYTGYQATVSSLGELISFQGKQRSAVYQGKCGRIQTSIGELRPAPIELNRTLEMFRPEFGRVMHLRPTGVRRIREGTAIPYVLAEDDFRAAQDDPERQCYCINGTKDNYCSLNGALELAPVSHNAPIVMTMAHLELDPKITKGIENWDSRLIDSNIDSEIEVDKSCQFLILRSAGIPIQFDMTVVLFLKVVREPRFKQMTSIPEISYIPLLMQRDIFRVPEKFTAPLIQLEAFLNVARHLKVAMYVSAIFLLGLLSSVHYQRTAGDRIGPSSQENSNQRRGTDGANNVSQTRFGKTTNEDEQDRQNVSTYPRLDKFIVPVDIGNLSAQADQQVTSMSGRKSSEASFEPQQPLGGTNQVIDGVATSESKSAAGYQKQATIFSKVDEGLELSMKSSQQKNNPKLATSKGQLRLETSNEAIGRNLNDAKMHDVNRDDRIESAGESNSRNNDDNIDDTTNTMNTSAHGRIGSSSKLHRNWFIRVYADVVRVLSDFRRSITNASQLDIRENDFHDRQLEMLAGKIDNWYGASNSGCDLDDQESEQRIEPSPSSTLAGSRRIGETNDSSVRPTEVLAATVEANKSSSQGLSKLEPLELPTEASGKSDGNVNQPSKLKTNEVRETARRLGSNFSQLSSRAGETNLINMADSETQTEDSSDMGPALTEEAAAELAEAKTTTLAASSSESSDLGKTKRVGELDERENSSKLIQATINKSDTSLDESVSGIQALGLATEDKAAALRQLEKSISRLEAGDEMMKVGSETEALDLTSELAASLVDKAEEESSEIQPRHLMIERRNSETNKLLELAAGLSQDLGENEGGHDGQTENSKDQRKEKEASSDEQIDELGLASRETRVAGQNNVTLMSVNGDEAAIGMGLEGLGIGAKREKVNPSSLRHSNSSSSSKPTTARSNNNKTHKANPNVSNDDTGNNRQNPSLTNNIKSRKSGIGRAKSDIRNEISGISGDPAARSKATDLISTVSNGRQAAIAS